MIYNIIKKLIKYTNYKLKPCLINTLKNNLKMLRFKEINI